MAKQLALSTQLKNATARITELEKKLASETSSKDSWFKRSEECSAEIEQVHALMDVLPGAAARKVQVGEESWNTRELKLMTRLSAYLANRATA